MRTQARPSEMRGSGVEKMFNPAELRKYRAKMNGGVLRLELPKGTKLTLATTGKGDVHGTINGRQYAIRAHNTEPGKTQASYLEISKSLTDLDPFDPILGTSKLPGLAWDYQGYAGVHPIEESGSKPARNHLFYGAAAGSLANSPTVREALKALVRAAREVDAAEKGVEFSLRSAWPSRSGVYKMTRKP